MDQEQATKPLWQYWKNILIINAFHGKDLQLKREKDERNLNLLKYGKERGHATTQVSGN